MKAGEPFRWQTKAGRQVNRTQRTQDRHHPAHVDIHCDSRARWAAEAVRKQEIDNRVAYIAAEMIAGRMSSSQAAELLTAPLENQ
jgi:predicted deacylase